MPKIPTNIQPISTDVSGGSYSEQGAGVAQKAAGDLGATVANIGFSLLKDVKMAEARDAVFVAQNQDAEQLRQLRATLQNSSSNGYVTGQDGQPLKNANGTPRTISQEFTEKSTALFRQRQMSMPSRLAQDQYVAAQDSVFRGYSAQIFNDEQVSKVNYFKQNTLDQINKAAIDSFTNPDLNMFSERIGLLKSHVASSSGPNGIQSVDEGSKISKDGSAEIGEKFFEGILNNALAAKKGVGPRIDRRKELERGLGILRDQDKYVGNIKKNGGTTPSSVLTANQRVSLETKFLQAKAQAAAIDAGEGSAIIAGIKGNFDLGNLSNAKSDLTKVAAVVNSLSKQNGGPWGPNEAQEKLFDVAATYKAAEITQSVGYKNGTFQEREAMLRALPESTANLARQMGAQGEPTTGANQTKQSLDKAKTFADESFKLEEKNSAAFQVTVKDSPQYILHNNWRPTDPRTTEVLKSTAEEAFRRNEEGVEKRFGHRPDLVKYLEDHQVKDIVNQFKSPQTNPDLIVQTVDSLFNNFPDRAPLMMEQMIASGDLGADWRIVNYFQKSTSKTAIISSLRTPPQEEAQLWNDLKLKGDLDKATAESEIHELMSDWRQGMALEKPDSLYSEAVVNSLDHVATTHALKLLRTMDWDSAKAAMRKKFVDDTVTFIPLRANNGKFFNLFGAMDYNFMAPKDIVAKQDVPLVSANLEKITATADNLRSLGAEPPPRIDPETHVASPTQFSAEFYDQIQRTGFVTKDTSYKGAAVWYTEPDGSIIRVFTNKNGAIVPLVVPWSKLKDKDFLPGTSSTKAKIFGLVAD